MTAKVLVGLTLYFVAVILALGFVYLVMKSMGLRDYAAYALLVLWCVFLGAMCVRRVRKSEYQGGIAVPGGEAHTLGLRRTVQEELRRHRDEPPAPHP